MKKNRLASSLMVLLLSAAVWATAEVPTIYKLDIKKEIGSTTWIYIQKGFEEAQARNASEILIHLNTYGGEVVYADSIRTKILQSEIPVYVFIDNNAASAGALISLACDKIFMQHGATIGATTVVDQTGQKVPDKYQSYMRATMRATAEAQGRDTLIQGRDTVVTWVRDPRIAEAMVDEDIAIEGIVEEGKILTFTAEEAMRHGFCDGMASNVRELIREQLQYQEYELIQYQPTAMDNLVGFLSSTIVQGLLIMLIIGGIYFELQTPGVGFPLIGAIVAAILYFAPLYLEGLAANWEIVLFVIGLILIGLELFVVPGFGITGISGILMVVVGLTLSMIENVVFDFSYVPSGKLSESLLTVTTGVLLSIGLMIYLTHKIGSRGIFAQISLNKTLSSNEGYVGTEVLTLNHRQGVAATVLRPSGKVIIDGSYYDAVSETTFIEKGSSIVVTRSEGGRVYVEEVKQ